MVLEPTGTDYRMRCIKAAVWSAEYPSGRITGIVQNDDGTAAFTVSYPDVVIEVTMKEVPR